MARTTDKKKEGMGARVEAARKQKGWSQEQLADYLMISRSAVKSKEMGDRPFTLEEACKLSAFFNVTLDYLVNGVSTENVDIHSKTGLTDKGIEALETYNMLYDDGNRMEVISEVLAHPEVLDTLYEYMTFHPSYKGYFRKQVTEHNDPFVTCLMSPELYEDQLQTILMRVIRLAKEGKQPSWYYSSLQEFLSTEGDEKLKLAEPSGFKGAKKNAKKK